MVDFSLTNPDAPLAIGPSGWQYPHWEGVIYPRRRPGSFHPLEFLARRFDTVEIATSFETPIRPEVAKLWMGKVQANPHFRFTARVPRQFTHERQLDKEGLDRFLPGLRELQRGKHLGAVVMQFPWAYRFTRENRDYFVELRRAFHEFRLVAEMRHESWMSSEAVGTLIDYRVGFCNLDQPEHTMPSTALLTSPIGCFRLHGRRYSLAELASWKERVEQVRGIAERTFCIFTNDAAGQAVLNAMQFGSMFDKPARRAISHDSQSNLSLAVA